LSTLTKPIWSTLLCLLGWSIPSSLCPFQFYTSPFNNVIDAFSCSFLLNAQTCFFYYYSILQCILTLFFVDWPIMIFFYIMLFHQCIIVLFILFTSQACSFYIILLHTSIHSKWTNAYNFLSYIIPCKEFAWDNQWLYLIVVVCRCLVWPLY